MAEWPIKILVIDTDGGVISAIMDDKEYQNADEEDIPVYNQKKYYHSLADAIRDEF